MLILCLSHFIISVFKENLIFILAAWYSVHISFFSVRWCLRNHLKSVHLEEKTFKCKFCNCQTSFASEGRLTTHILRVHEKTVVRLTRLIYEFKNSNRKNVLFRYLLLRRTKVGTSSIGNRFGRFISEELMGTCQFIFVRDFPQFPNEKMLRIVIWHFFFRDLSQSEKLSEI